MVGHWEVICRLNGSSVMGFPVWAKNGILPHTRYILTARYPSQSSYNHRNDQLYSSMSRFVNNCYVPGIAAHSAVGIQNNYIHNECESGQTVIFE